MILNCVAIFSLVVAYYTTFIKGLINVLLNTVENFIIVSASCKSARLLWQVLTPENIYKAKPIHL